MMIMATRTPVKQRERLGNGHSRVGRGLNRRDQPGNGPRSKGSYSATCGLSKPEGPAVTIKTANMGERAEPMEGQAWLKRRGSSEWARSRSLKSGREAGFYPPLL